MKLEKNSKIRIQDLWAFVKLFEAIISVLECLFEPLRAISVMDPKRMFPRIGESVIVLYSFRIMRGLDRQK